MPGLIPTDDFVFSGVPLEAVILPRQLDCRLGDFRSATFELHRSEIARRTATVESAAPLPPDLQAGIEAGLKRRYGPGLSTAFAHDPALIGGMRIQVGSDVYDGSVRAGLEALEQSF